MAERQVTTGKGPIQSRMSSDEGRPSVGARTDQGRAPGEDLGATDRLDAHGSTITDLDLIEEDVFIYRPAPL